MKRLQDIDFSTGELLKFIIKNNLEIPPDLMLSSLGSLVFKTFSIPGVSPRLAVKKIGIDFIQSNTGDAGVILGGFAFLSSFPEAQKMLWHYLTGNGEDVEINTERVLKEDNKLKNFIMSSIMKEAIKHKTRGIVNVQQDVYENQNWRNAFGSINVKWIMTPGKVKLWIEDRYDWHPNERRVTQSVHQAMTRAKRYGAKAFNYHGTFFSEFVLML